METEIRLGEHIYKLPKVPPPHEILFSKEKKENQYWRRKSNKDFPQTFFDFNPFTKLNADRTEYNDEEVLIKLSVEDTKELIKLQNEEMRKRIEGVWFMNNGEPTYLTGAHYFVLQWCAMYDCTNEELYSDPDEQHFGSYREFQRDFFYFIDLCKKDINCLGGFIAKPKKTGISMLVALDYLEESTRTKNKRFGIMSKNKDEARDTNFQYYKYAMDNLPYIFKPKIGNETQTRILYAVPRKKHTGTAASALAQLNNNKGFNTEVFAAPTVADAFDGPKMYRVWLDEFPKYDDPSPWPVFMKTQETVKLQKLISGKMWITSYPPEDDSDSFKEARKVYYNSKKNTITVATGRTISELYVYYISVLDSSTTNFDKYGRCDRDATRAEIMAKRDQLKGDTVALQGYIRQYSITEEECWREGGGGASAFNNILLSKRKGEIETDHNAGKLPYEEGYFEWTNGIPLSPPIWVKVTPEDKENGIVPNFRFYRKELINPELFNRVFKLNIRDRSDCLMPADDGLFVGATDPTDYVLKDDVLVGSKNAITAMILPDATINSIFGGKNVTDRMVLEYLDRPDDPDDYADDFFKAVLYLGMPVLVEANKPWLATKMKKVGLHNFLLFRTKERTIEPYNPALFQQLTTTVRAGNTDVIEDLSKAIAGHIRKPRTEEEQDLLSLYDSERLIEQLMNFKTTDTKRYDLAMCWGLNLLARNGLMAYRLRQKAQKSKYDPEVMKAIWRQIM